MIYMKKIILLYIGVNLVINYVKKSMRKQMFVTKQSSLKQIISTMTIITKIMPVQKKLRKSIENLIKLLQLSY